MFQLSYGILDSVVLLVLILAYKVLLSLKRCEIELDNKYASAEQIVKALQRHFVYEKIFIMIWALFFGLIVACNVLF